MGKQSPEKLHRLINGENDWDAVPDDQLNTWQRVAKRTRGIITIGNTITLSSTILVLNGLEDFANGQRFAGLAKVMGGRAGDLVDGKSADMTGTKGRVGHDFDPSVDAIQLMVALPLLEHTGYLPIIPAVAMGASKVADTVGSVAARLRKVEMNPTEEGKLGAFALWGGIGSFMLRGALEHHMPGFADTALAIAGFSGTVGGTIYKTPATLEYLRAGFGPMNEVAPVVEPPSNQL